MKTGQDCSGGIFDVDDKLTEIAALDEKIADSGFWNDNKVAQKILQKRSALQRSVEIWKNLDTEREDLGAMLELSDEEEDASMEEEIGSSLTQLSEQVAQAELKAMLSGESDFNNAIVAINSGAGGTESQDWAEMLLRMYLRWGDRNGYKTEV
ncbi:MAG: PCRF domain-containing protein, partial [Nitrospinaceae bacterium]|nr:PCRF domain-containing protein [Nitrospinaceae bacterium]